MEKKIVGGPWNLYVLVEDSDFEEMEKNEFSDFAGYICRFTL
jgi:hypothetical protein